MIILDGKKLSEEILAGLKKEVARRKYKMKLSVILIGNDPASEIFVRRKELACSFVGVKFNLHHFSSDVNVDRFKEEIVKISRDPKVSGIIIQLPLPPTINKQEVFDLIPSNKDVDILSAHNLGKFYTGDPLYMPPVVGAVSHFFKKYGISPVKKNIVVVGAGRLVGFPLSLWLFRKKATISIVNEFTENMSFYTKKADIIISGVGKRHIIKGNMVKRGVIVIDVGTSFKGKKLFGDFDFGNIAKKSAYITPVPGGVGPVTVACLLENLLALNKNEKKV